jgi:phosphate-selective porin OprO/OprP
MTELTSIRELPFLERPLIFGDDVFFRQTGIMLFNSTAQDRVTWNLSGFRYLSDNFGNVYSDSGGYGLATRITCLAIDAGHRLLHLGVDYSYKNPGRDVVQLGNTNEFFIGQNPLVGAGGLSVLPIVRVPSFVATGPIDARSEQVFNVEAAVAFGRLALQSEVRWAVVEDNSGVVNTFPGAYAHVRYTLTGEEIPFNRSGAVFGRIKPLCPVDWRRGGWGAWELAARLSHLDLNGENLPGPGRRLTDTTVGVNWYLNDYTKFQCNWIHAELDDPRLGDSTADTFAMRGQLDF